MISAASVVLGVEVEGASEKTPRQVELPVHLMGPSGHRPGRRRVRTQLGPQRRRGQTRLVRWSSIAPHTAFSNSSSSRSYAAGSTAASRWKVAAAASGPDVLSVSATGPTTGGSKRAQGRHSLARPLGRHIGDRRDGDVGEGEVERCRRDGRGGDGVGVGQYDDPGPPLRHQHEPRAEPRVGTAVAQRSVAAVAAHPPAERPRVLPGRVAHRHHRLPHPVEQPGVQPCPLLVGTSSSLLGRREVGDHPATHLDQVGVQGRAGGMAPGVGIGTLGHRQRHPHVR